LTNEITSIEQIENQTDIWELFDSVPKGNSQFQIKRMLLQEYGPERAYRFAVLQLRTSYEALKTARIDRDRAKVKMRRARARAKACFFWSSKRELLLLDAEQHELELKLQEGLVKDAFIEVQAYLDALKELPKVTRKSFEAGEQNYWERRFNCQAQREALQAVSGISSGLLENFEKMGGDAYDLTRGVIAHRGERLNLPSPDNARHD